MSQKFRLPENFHQRILDLEKLIEQEKEQTPHAILRSLTLLYSVNYYPVIDNHYQQAIEYYGYIDDNDSCIDLNLRRSRMYNSSNSSKSGKSQSSSDSVESSSSSSSGSQGSEEEEEVDRLSNSNNEIGSKGRSNEEDYDEVVLMDKEMSKTPSNKSFSLTLNQNAPESHYQTLHLHTQITKKKSQIDMDEIMNDKYKINVLSDFEIITPRGEIEKSMNTPKNNSRDKKLKAFQSSRRSSKFQSIEEIKTNQEYAIKIIQSEQKDQSQNFQDRLRNRKINKMVKTQMDYSLQQLNNGGYQDKSILNIYYNVNLNAPGSTIDQYQQEYQQDEEDENEGLQELDKRKEEILEEFLEYAFQKKHEALEQIRGDCKKNKTPKDEEKKLVFEASKVMDTKRKQGMADLTKQMNLIIMDVEQPINEKLNRLQDKEQINTFIHSMFQTQQEQISGLDM
ncbi:UNKNOWN [Stylonychia lemnae]|uniref:Uncharacterized protein n=1 Tax=Stylonychia lemnae TaxID=5949 RepID=A0A078BE52_STYLE|nr:UNKNOWN [Stylonychia lemnae]|eukprot:CDW91422.1 UNKNOWN [Stylonychia lemnae]